MPRAIESSLAGMKPGELEVIVVPNGPDTSWQKSLKPFYNNQAVHIIPIQEANANVARNSGLDNAKGEFIRFLDDDDYLVPECAVNQYKLIKSSDADVVSGSIQLLGTRGQHIDIWHQPDMDDLCAAVLGPWRMTAIMAHVYRHASLDHNKWNPKTLKSQDLEWLFDLCSSKDRRWRKTKDIVAVWYHHWKERISPVMSHNEARKNIVVMLLRTYDRLCQTDRANQYRRSAMAIGLWGLIHAAFFLEPVYWTQVALTAKAIDPFAKPIQNLYHYPLIRNLDPLHVQRLMLPKRWIAYQIRMILGRLKLRHHW